MSQVHPDSPLSPHVCIGHKFCSTSSTVFTVWKKSLLLNGKGFTVFDSLGQLVFRVDNYASNAKNEVFLMDDAGQLLLTLRRKVSFYITLFIFWHYFFAVYVFKRSFENQLYMSSK